MDYPTDFPQESRARVEAERLRAVRELEQNRKAFSSSYGPTREDEQNLRHYILRVFLAFAHEACELGLQGRWPVERIRSEADEFLRLFTIEAYYSQGHDQAGRKLADMLGDCGGLLPEVRRKFEESPEWSKFQDELLAVAERQATRVAEPNAGSVVARLSKNALARMDAETASFMAAYIPKLEREANKAPARDVELLQELVAHFYNLVARECLLACTSAEEFEALLRSDIARFVHYRLGLYPWLADRMREELDAGFTFFIIRVNPWTQIAEEERGKWHVGAATGETLSHAALKWQAEALKRAAAGGLPQSESPDEAAQPSEGVEELNAAPATSTTGGGQEATVASKRRLAALMFTDIVGYSAMTQRNEALAQGILDEHNRILRQIFMKHNGREVKTTGDGFLVEFPSALEGARCAIEMQQALLDLNFDRPPERCCQIRIGLHLGDVIGHGDDVSGDAVNIAARIVPLAEAGGICLSENLAREIQNKIDVTLEKMGTPELKNIQSRIETYRMLLPPRRPTSS